MNAKCLLCFLTFACAVPNIVHADLISNGSFESPPQTMGAFLTIGPGDEPSGFAWTVFSGNVDVAHLPVSPFVQFSAFEGNQAIDLNGTVRGSIFQDFATNPGQQYGLTFAYSDNPSEGGVSSALVSVTDTNSMVSLLSTSVMHSTSTNGPPADADWFLFSNTFTATGSTTRLAFTSTSASNTPSGGIILDAVSVSAIPEPNSLFLVGLGLAGTMLRRRK